MHSVNHDRQIDQMGILKILQEKPSNNYFAFSFRLSDIIGKK